MKLKNLNGFPKEKGNKLICKIPQSKDDEPCLCVEHVFYRGFNRALKEVGELEIVGNNVEVTAKTLSANLFKIKGSND